MSGFKIEKNVPLPGRTAARNNRYPFDDMEVGDSFHVPADKLVLRGLRASVRYKSAKSGKRFATRKLASGDCRVWRAA